MGSQDSEKRGFLIPLNIITQARKDGLGLERLQEMVRLSARCTHADGNRRYKDAVFMVVGKRVVKYTKVGADITLQGEPDPVPMPPATQQPIRVEPPPQVHYYRCEICKDTGRVQVFDPCEHCDAVGCNKCDEGLVPSSIPCQMCDSKAKQMRR